MSDVDWSGQAGSILVDIYARQSLYIHQHNHALELNQLATQIKSSPTGEPGGLHSNVYVNRSREIIGSLSCFSFACLIHVYLSSSLGLWRPSIFSQKGNPSSLICSFRFPMLKNPSLTRENIYQKKETKTPVTEPSHLLRRNPNVEELLLCESSTQKGHYHPTSSFLIKWLLKVKKSTSL